MKNKIGYSILIFLASSVAAVYFVILPAIADIKTVGTEINAQRLDLEKRYIQGQNLRKLANNLKTVESKISSLDSIFIDQNRALEFITTLEESAAKHNVVQKINLMTEKSVTENKYKKTPLNVIITGNFINILDYITELEGLVYYININSVDIASSAGQRDAPPGSVSMQISANTYWK